MPEISSTTQYRYYAAFRRIERPGSTVFPVARGMSIKQEESEVLLAKVPGQWLKEELMNRYMLREAKRITYPVKLEERKKYPQTNAQDRSSAERAFPLRPWPSCLSERRCDRWW